MIKIILIAFSLVFLIYLFNDPKGTLMGLLWGALAGIGSTIYIFVLSEVGHYLDERKKKKNNKSK